MLTYTTMANLIKEAIMMTGIKIKNIDTVATKIYKLIEEDNNSTIKLSSQEGDILDALQDTIYKILISPNIISTLKSMLKENKYIWNGKAFNRYIETEKVIAELQNEVDVEEGVLECPKCGNNKVLSYQIQTRSADEPMTIFARCINKTCLHRWKE